MTEIDDDPAALRAHAEALEERLQKALETHRSQLAIAELKAEAVRSGMIDLDGLKLVDATEIRMGADGHIEGAAELMKALRGRKPWLFSDRHSSSPGSPPPVQPPEQKLATQMSYEEWRGARAELLKQR
jgi:hypothetical protein